ncbi:TonB-dependent receptor [Nibricoccus sp. IMCC34717]|uniref:TonB-dependent receptor n=1 Tax=Nibricoccus sp. IMCC34717 TaxID=3034021 RepID=UPI00384FB9F8
MTLIPVTTPRARLRACLTAFAALATASLFADGRVEGVVSDKLSKAALPGAEVTVVGANVKAVSATDGSFRLNLPAGTYQLMIDYLGYESQTQSVTVADGASVPARFNLTAEEVIQLAAFEVTGIREGQARANNQQRTSQNLTTIISADLSGQFPDKTIADAVKRLPGVTVETDTDTGGSEGRYVTIRGMNADFNAVTVNGMRVAVSDFGGLSRRVPLDVVSAKSADQIEVTKALRPDQDGDGIGGAVNIVTRSPFDRNGAYAFAEGAIGMSALLREYTDDYRFSKPNVEASAGYANTLANNTWGFSVAANMRERVFQKQRVGTQGWAADGGPGGTYYPIGLGIQDFWDNVSATGFNGTIEWRPSEDNKLRFDLSYSDRLTERGRQRLVNGLIDGGAGTANGDTYGDYTATGRMVRNIRQFFEDQKILNMVMRGEKTMGDWNLEYFAGYNDGKFNGDPDRDINVQFRTSSTRKTFVSDGYFPYITGSTYLARVNDPSRYFAYRMDRSTSFVTDREFATGFDAKKEQGLFGGTGYIKAGFKARLFDRDYDYQSRVVRFRSGVTNDWALDGFIDRPEIGSSLATYKDPAIVHNRYDLGFYINPEVVRDSLDRMQSSLSMLENMPDSGLRSLVNSYRAEEDIYAAYLMAQQTWGKLTVLAGARLEATEVRFRGYDGRTNPNNGLMQTVTPFSASKEHLSVLPGIHFRYSQNKNLNYRFAITRSIARPQLRDLNPSTLEDAFGEDAFSRPGGYIATLDRGNIKLKPTEATNVDLGVEYYFGKTSSVSATVFLKDMKNNVYRGYVFNDPAWPDYLVRTSLNAPSGWVRGIEVGYDQQLSFLPSPLDGFGVFANFTYADSKVDVGLAQYAGVRLPLFNQVKNTLSTGVFYDKGRFRARLSVLYRSESLFGLSIDEDYRDYDANLSRYMAPSTSVDFTASYRFLQNWQVFTQLQNLTNTPGRAYNVDKKRVDYNEYSGWSGSIGIRWNL